MNAQESVCEPQLWELQVPLKELSKLQKEELEDLQALSWGFSAHDSISSVLQLNHFKFIPYYFMYQKGKH